MLAGLFAAFLAATPLTGVDLTEGADTNAHVDPAFFLPLLAAAVACAAAFFWYPQERLTWGVLAVALAVGAAAEAAFPVSHQEDEGMSAGAAVAYGFFCVASGATLLAASGDFRLRRAIDQGLGVCAFGLATVWSWLFFASGGSTSDIVHSALDLVLALAVLAALCNHGWPLSPRFAMLAGGFGLIAVADAMHAHGILSSVLGLNLADALPFVAAALITATASLGIHSGGERGRSGRLVVILSLLAILLAVTVLVYDHYSRLSAGTVALASLTLLAAGIRLTLTQRGWRDARARARDAEAAGAVEESVVLDAAIVVGADGRIASCNERARWIFRRSEKEIVGKPVAELLGEGQRSWQDLLAAADAGSPLVTVEMCAYGPHGVALPVEVAVGSPKEGSGLRTVVVRDISDRRRREEENRRLAAIIRSSEDAVLTKDLTGVITGWNQGAERLYGYSAREAIGREVGELIIPRERRDEAERVLTEAATGETVSFETQRITKDGTRIDVSLRAFPISGLSGEVTAVCTVGHDVSDRRRRERAEARETEATLWRGRLRKALGDGSLLFHGQPVLDLKSGRTHHHELLVRMWLDGELILPGSFLPFAEETDLIRDLDLWAVERGVALARRLPVAVNLSARSLGSRGLLGAIEKRLGENASPARNLIFEITETAAAENMQGARELVGELKKMGCGIALDDFGTGYGSFTYLRHLPVTQLKIDTEFIAGITNDDADRRVVESMVAVARNFEMTTVAEGVEDRETFERLGELGIDLVQGYFVGRPQPLELGREAVIG